MILGVLPLSYVSLSFHSCALLKSRIPTRPSRVLSREAYRFESNDIPLYVSLDPSQEDIRLLVVHLGQDSSDIVCSLQEVSLLKNPKFTALSYHWKAPIFQSEASRWTFDLPEIPIIVEGRDFLVTPNLDAALHHLRKPDSPLKIWVDAICINQANDKEKESQIPLMDKIYGQAETTYLWLGPAAEDSDTAMDFIASSANTSTMAEINALSPPLPALRALYSRTWWSRIWVVQEALLSKNAIFICGQRQVPLQIFIQLAGKEYAFDEQWKSGHWQAATKQFSSRWIFMPAALPFYNFFLQRYHEQNQTFMISSRNILFSKSRSIWEALLSTTAFNSTLPRDRIYGLLAIAPRTSRAAIDVDYSGRKTDGDIFKELTVHVLKSCYSLTPLLHVEAGSTVLGLPSWAFDPSKVDVPRQTIKGLGNDSFRAGGSDLGWERLVHPVGGILWTIVKAASPRLYSAIRPPSYEDRSTSRASFSDGDNTLILRGIFFDTISFTGSLGKLPEVPESYYTNFERKTIPSRQFVLRVAIPNACRRWEQAIKLHCPYNPYDTPQGRYEAFLRTLTVNRLEYSKNALGARYAYDIMIGRKPSSFSPRTRQKMDMVVGSFVGTVAEALNKRAFIITERGFLGVAPEMAREGDAVCILQGGCMPFVLRPKGDDQWEFVGECYVHGIMNGEVVGEAKREDVKMFRLV